MEHRNLSVMGFHTMSDKRCRQTSVDSALARGVIVITEKCNYRCPYCRTWDGSQMSRQSVLDLLATLGRENLDTILFTGGEPTMHPDLRDFVIAAAQAGIRHIGLATNGSASPDLYRHLRRAGIEEFFISLDADDPSVGDRLAGRTRSAWNRVVANIRALSQVADVCVGIVVNEQNLHRLPDVVEFAKGLGVRDIRVNPAAQYSAHLPAEVLAAVSTRGYSTLDWRISNMRRGVGVRGLKPSDAARCWLVQDELTINGDSHYPCFVYMREGGAPIGRMGPGFREERREWMQAHRPFEDPVCRANCPDCCSAFNRRYEHFHPDAGVDSRGAADGVLSGVSGRY